MSSGVNRGGRGRTTTSQHATLYVDTNDDTEDVTLSADRGVYFSSDMARRKEELMNIAHKKRRLESTDADELAEWSPVEVPEVGLTPGDPVATESSDSTPVVLGKRKTYDSSTDPMRLWRPLAQFFLDELTRHDGPGDRDASALSCAWCDVAYVPPSKDVPQPVVPPVRLFKCSACGEYHQCKTCLLAAHATMPLHAIQEWNGTFWVDISLRDLGLIYQLGHGGLRCPYPDSRILLMTVIDVPLIHRVRYQYCKCQKASHSNNLQQCLRNKWYPATVTDPATCATFASLETFRLQNVVGNMNVNDFITAMERQTNAAASTGMDWIPHRYKEFMRMTRQWAWLYRAKRAGRAFDVHGLMATAARECAVLCWACPHDQRNLPADWRKADPKFRFLYMLLVAVDANFKLKNRMRLNEHPDPSLGPGWAYFVEPEGYRRQIKKYIPEKDISSCIAFAALLQKDTRNTSGLRTSGVGGCVCARHECVLPNGIGDLQKGERFVNMDYILLAALMGFVLWWLTISYDISCQWKINFASRMEKMPKAMRLPLDKMRLQCALPVWHAASHDEVCQSENSLSFKPGVGKSDGEGVERTWAVLNPASYHTKDMSKGNRVDTLESKIDSHNFLKNLGLGDALRRKLAVARAERDRQVAAYKEVTASVEHDVLEEWLAMIKTWLKDPSKPNPYTLDKHDGPTETAVRLQLKKEEEREAVSGKTPLHGTSATAFLVAGLQIEQAQRRIIAEVAGLALVAPEREARIQELRIALLKKFSTFRDLQDTYMPGAKRALRADEANRNADVAPPRVEHMKVYMPHELPEDERALGCVNGLPEMEAKLREAQCGAALIVVRGRLHAKRHLITFRNEHLTGQVQVTKARTLIQQVGERVTAGAQKYRKAREALVVLKGASHAPHFRELKDDDIRLDGDNGESDTAALKKLAMIGSGKGARAPRNAPGQSKRVMSWIWTVQAGSGDEEQDLHDSVRVEWTRARARKTRWEEEVMLLTEEMRRTLRYLTWQANWWEARAEARPNATPQIRAGLRAYSAKQAAFHCRLHAHFKQLWEKKAVVDTEAVMERADLEQFFTPTPSVAVA
ncbi:hypothetical protein C8R43DRAFT_1138146 [Mycena crocata]|nr:hypothetical protein C8R43DRAFT_1138146 [Mycena crocata]